MWKYLTYKIVCHMSHDYAARSLVVVAYQSHLLLVEYSVLAVMKTISIKVQCTSVYKE